MAFRGQSPILPSSSPLRHLYEESSEYSTVTCPECGYLNDAYKQTCSVCETQLRGSSPQVSPTTSTATSTTATGTTRIRDPSISISSSSLSSYSELYNEAHNNNRHNPAKRSRTASSTSPSSVTSSSPVPPPVLPPLPFPSPLASPILSSARFLTAQHKGDLALLEIQVNIDQNMNADMVRH